MVRPKPYVLTWCVCLVVSLLYFIRYVVKDTPVPVSESVMVFLQFYIVFGLMFGVLFYFLYKIFRKMQWLNVCIIAAAHVIFVYLLFQELNSFPWGSFFERAP